MRRILTITFALALAVPLAPVTARAQFFDRSKVRPAQSDSERAALREALDAGAKEGRERRAAQLDTMAASADRLAARSGDRDVIAAMRWRADSLRMEAAAIRNPRLPRPGARPQAVVARTRDPAPPVDRGPTGTVPPAPAPTTEPPDASTPLPRTSNGGNSGGGRDPRARIMVYATSTAAGAINVSIDGVVQGGLIEALSTGQPCGAPGALTMTVAPGTHTLAARGTRVGTDASWGPVQRTVAAGECYVWRLDGGGAAAVVTAPPQSEPTVVNVVFWTRRSPNIEGFTVSVDGREIAPMMWSFQRAPNDCRAMPTHAIRTYAPGGQFLIETHVSISRDFQRPRLSAHHVTVPGVTCYFWEIR